MRDYSSRLRIVVLGYVVRCPLGGMAWHHLQYVLGLKRLGHDVYFLEDSDDYTSCYNPQRDVMDTDPSYGVDFAKRVFSRIDLGERWAYYDAHTSRWFGPLADTAVSICQSADVVINVSGVNPLRDWTAAIPVRALVDTDPVFTQIRHLTDPIAMHRASHHNVFFSFGENIGKPDCTVPDDGICWQPTRQPVVLDAWPIAPPNPQGAFTTVMQWQSYPAREFNGCRYGMKADSFAPYMALPSKTTETLELALGNRDAPREVLTEKGWRLIDPRQPTDDPWTFRNYIHQSKAEFSVAKHGYVASRCGWFSERTTSYLASGRPALVQDTGFTEWLETGAGLLAYSSPDEASDQLATICSDLSQHCRCAREIAEEVFPHDRVLTHLLDRAGARSKLPTTLIPQ